MEVMADTVIDVAQLAGVLENRIETDGISWRQAAGSIGVSPSLLSRLRNGQRPDLDAFVRITTWLGVPSDRFVRDKDTEQQADLTTEVSVLLRARSDLSENDKGYLEEIFRASLQHVRKMSPTDN